MVIDLTEYLKELLIAASEDGIINVSDFQSGRYIYAGGKSFPADLNNYDAAEAARYIDAVDLMRKRGLAKMTGKDLYELTSSGFEEGRSLKPREGSATRGTTKIGFVNPNGQVVIRDTGLPGTDHLQRIYQLGCSLCGHVYGSNGSDIHDRKCPKHDGGAKGLTFEN
ncbi:MAG TPA: hypothetical protein VG860_21695 [Terriglobia bacterium]|jgi:hypothetical protein|nr:hypothetical protein [Terriglobia bacterium]